MKHYKMIYHYPLAVDVVSQCHLHEAIDIGMVCALIIKEAYKKRQGG